MLRLSPISKTNCAWECMRYALCSVRAWGADGVSILPRLQKDIIDGVLNQNQYTQKPLQYHMMHNIMHLVNKVFFLGYLLIQKKIEFFPHGKNPQNVWLPG